MVIKIIDMAISIEVNFLRTQPLISDAELQTHRGITTHLKGDCYVVCFVSFLKVGHCVPCISSFILSNAYNRMPDSILPQKI